MSEVAPSTTATVPRPPGLVRAIGVFVGDTGRVVRNPAIDRWRLILLQTDQLVRRSGPLAWTLCAFLGMFITLTGAEVFSRLGADRGLSGLLVASMGLRELAVIVGMAALAASAGAGYVTDVGAMRVEEEIDALDVMSIASFPYLVSTRAWAAVLGSIPLFIGCVAAMFFGGFFAATVQISGLNSGSYLAFFNAGFAPVDILFALTKGVVAALVIAVVSSGTGYRATGGPAGVGIAVGNALNVSLVLVMVLNVILSYTFWGLTDTVKL